MHYACLQLCYIASYIVCGWVTVYSQLHCLAFKLVEMLVCRSPGPSPSSGQAPTALGEKVFGNANIMVFKLTLVFQLTCNQPSLGCFLYFIQNSTCICVDPECLERAEVCGTLPCLNGGICVIQNGQYHCR